MYKKYSTLWLVFSTLYTNDSYTSMKFDPLFLYNFPINCLSYKFKSVIISQPLPTGGPISERSYSIYFEYSYGIFNRYNI
jgi:hypothetical protein